MLRSYHFPAFVYGEGWPHPLQSLVCFIVSAYIVEFSLNLSLPCFSLMELFFPCEFLNPQWDDSITARMYSYMSEKTLSTVAASWDQCCSRSVLVTGARDMVLHLPCAMGSQKVPRSPVSHLCFPCWDLIPIVITLRDDPFWEWWIVRT